MQRDERGTLAVSTWSFHRVLGTSYRDKPGDEVQRTREPTWGEGELTLHELPARLRAEAMNRLEICTFHIDRHDVGFLRDLRAALADAGTVFQTLLIDDGDVTDPENGGRDRDWIRKWIDVAAELGAEKARVIGGKQAPSVEAVSASIAALRELSAHGSSVGVRIITENWHPTVAGAEEAHRILDEVGDGLGFLADTWNWRGDVGFGHLEALLPRAENCHLHYAFDENLDEPLKEVERALEIVEASGFSGPYTLIYADDNPDEWKAVRRARDLANARLLGAAA